MDWLSALRFANIFGGGNNPALGGMDLPSQGGITGNMGMPTQINPTVAQMGMGGPPPDMPVTTGLPGMDDGSPPPFIPSHSAQDAYNAMIKRYPGEEKHGRLARLGAAIVSGLYGWQGDIGKGIGVGRDVLEYKHNKAVENWKNQIDPLEKAASLERQENQMGMYNTTNNRRIDVTEKKNETTAGLKSGELKIKENVQKLQEWKAKHPNAKWDLSGPTIKVFDPATKQITDTGIETGKLSDKDKLEIIGQNRIDAIDEIAANRPDKTEERKPMEIPDPRDPTGVKRIGVWVTKDGKMTPITAGDVGGMPPTPGIDPNAPINAPVKPGAPNPAADKEQKMQVVRQKAQEALDSMNDLIDDKDQLTENTKQIVGKSRMFGIQNIPGTKARSAEIALNNFKANRILGLIAEMKAQSRTGATGFGQMSMKELNVLEQAATKLDPSGDEEIFRQELVKMRDKLKKILQPENSMDSTTTIKKKTPQQLWDENQ